MENFTVLRPEEHFCRENLCAMGDKDGPYYHDHDHLNIRGAEFVSSWLAKQLAEAQQAH